MNARAIFMGLAFAFMWSSAFTSARVIVEYAPPIASLSLRFLLSGVIGVGIALALGQRFRLTRAQWRATIIFGICQNALYLGLNFVAMQWIEAGLASIIASTMPLMVALAGWMVFGDKLRPMAVIGLVMGFVGVALIMGGRLDGGLDWTGVALCIIGAMALTIATLSVRGGLVRWQRDDDRRVADVRGLCLFGGCLRLYRNAHGHMVVAIDRGLYLHHAGAGSYGNVGVVYSR